MTRWPWKCDKLAGNGVPGKLLLVLQKKIIYIFFRIEVLKQRTFSKVDVDSTSTVILSCKKMYCYTVKNCETSYPWLHVNLSLEHFRQTQSPSWLVVPKQKLR